MMVKYLIKKQMIQKYEARRKTLAFTFGRFNPPTIGHEKLINKVASVRADDYRIYLSRSEDSKKNHYRLEINQQ